LAEKSEDDREKVSKKVEETEHLDQDADGWPFEEDEEYPAEEAGRPAQLVLAREEVKRLLRADDEEEAAQEEDVSEGEESRVE